MSGYSATPLIKKLGIKPDDKVLFINEPVSIYKDLGTLPQTSTLPPKTKSMIDHTHFDYIHYFAIEKNELEKFFKEVKKVLDKNGMLWISWPKKTSGVITDLDENIIREVGLKEGLVDVKVAVIDEIWSGLKFVYRIKDR